ARSGRWSRASGDGDFLFDGAGDLRHGLLVRVGVRRRGDIHGRRGPDRDDVVDLVAHDPRVAVVVAEGVDDETLRALHAEDFLDGRGGLTVVDVQQRQLELLRALGRQLLIERVPGRDALVDRRLQRVP